MNYVYILQMNNQKLYIGSTRDLQSRIKHHRQGKVNYTKPHRPLKLVYYEAYLEESDARAREKFLKTGDGRVAIRKQLGYFLKTALIAQW